MVVVLGKKCMFDSLTGSIDASLWGTVVSEQVLTSTPHAPPPPLSRSMSMHILRPTHYTVHTVRIVYLVIMTELQGFSGERDVTFPLFFTHERQYIKFICGQSLVRRSSLGIKCSPAGSSKLGRLECSWQ